MESAAKTPAFVMSRADRIGDLILALPALGYLNRNLKESAKASLQKDVPLYLHHSPYTEDVATLALSNGLCDGLWPAGLAQPFQGKDPYFLSLQHNDRVRADLSLCGRKYSLGPRTKISTLWTYAETLKQSRSQVQKSEMEYNVDLVSWALNKWDVNESVKFQALAPLKLPADWTSPEKAQSQVVILSNRGSAGNWSWEKWLAKFVNSDDKHEAVDFLYYGDKTTEAQEFFKGKASELKNFRLLLNPFKKVSELAVYLKGAERVFASSTGPLHLAHALGVSVHGVYPRFEDSKVQSFKRWRPHGYAHAAAVSYEAL